MFKKTNIILSVLLTVSVLILFTGCEKKEAEETTQEQQVSAKEEVLDSAVIRTEGTDIAAIDVNGNGMLYQCPMHYEVISDTEGRCPDCTMYLEEYTVAQAEENFTGSK